MPYVLTETIHYSPSDAHDALDKIRQFALALGWTVDTWVSGTTSQLQLWSHGYVCQEMCYRLEVNNVDAQEQTLSKRGVIPGQRWSGFSLSSTYCWGGVDAGDYNTSLPASTFDALYLFGTKRFIAAIFHIDPIAVVTLHMGTWDLFPSWWYYGPGLWFEYNPQDGWDTTSTYKWYNMADNPSIWAPPMTQKWSTSHGYNIWYEGAKRTSTDFACNYRPTSTIAAGSEAGDFNRARGLCCYNDYTGKRMAFQSSFFVRNPTLGVWYPIGVSPFAWVNGRDLNIGEVITFGADQYRCFPGVFTLYEHWQAYRIA